MSDRSRVIGGGGSVGPGLTDARLAEGHRVTVTDTVPCDCRPSLVEGEHATSRVIRDHVGRSVVPDCDVVVQVAAVVTDDADVCRWLKPLLKRLRPEVGTGRHRQRQGVAVLEPTRLVVVRGDGWTWLDDMRCREHPPSAQRRHPGFRRSLGSRSG